MARTKATKRSGLIAMSTVTRSTRGTRASTPSNDILDADVGGSGINELFNSPVSQHDGSDVGIDVHADDDLENDSLDDESADTTVNTGALADTTIPAVPAADDNAADSNPPGEHADPVVPDVVDDKMDTSGSSTADSAVSTDPSFNSTGTSGRTLYETISLIADTSRRVASTSNSDAALVDPQVVSITLKVF